MIGKEMSDQIWAGLTWLAPFVVLVVVGLLLLWSQRRDDDDDGGPRWPF